jgi:membrane-bound ClpP family serine protease
MLTSVVSTSAVSSAASSSAGAITMMTDIGLPEYGVIAVIGLIVLLSGKEILSASDRWSTAAGNALDCSIYPLLLSFIAIVVFKVTEIL